MTATLLPNAKQQFINGNGIPLASGKVYFYIPNTSTLKNTWQDALQITLNTNPVILDASGEAIIYGTGEYRQVVYDASGNLIWDQLTQDLTQALQSSVALFCGTSTGSANAQILTPSPAVTSIITGQEFSFIVGFTNTSAMTLEISALTYNVKVGGLNTVLGNMVAGMVALVAFDGTNLQLINPQPSYGLPAPGANLNLLQSNGTIWQSVASIYATINSPTFTGTPKAPTPTIGDNSTLISTTKFVHDALSGILGAWTTASGNIVYQATTDGFFLAQTNNVGANGLIIYSDGSNPPTTIRQQIITGEETSNITLCAMSPIRKGDYYKSTCSSPATHYWIPLGN